MDESGFLVKEGRKGVPAFWMKEKPNGMERMEKAKMWILMGQAGVEWDARSRGGKRPDGKGLRLLNQCMWMSTLGCLGGAPGVFTQSGKWNQIQGKRILMRLSASQPKPVIQSRLYSPQGQEHDSPLKKACWLDRHFPSHGVFLGRAPVQPQAFFIPLSAYEDVKRSLKTLPRWFSTSHCWPWSIRMRWWLPNGLAVVVTSQYV